MLYLVFSIFCFESLISQELRINVYRARVSDVAVTTNYLESSLDPLVISSGSQYGTGVEMVFKRAGSIELLGLRQVNFHTADERHSESTGPVLPSAVNYLLLSAGGHLENPLSELQGYGAVVAGISIRQQQHPGPEPVRALAWGGRLGCTWWVVKKVGVKVESMFLFSQSPVYDPPILSPTRSFTLTSIHQVTMSGGVMFRICGE